MPSPRETGPYDGGNGAAVTNVAVIGAAGVQGGRIADRLGASDEHRIALVESGAGMDRLRERGLDATPLDEAAGGADAVILAVPDGAILEVAREVSPSLRAGCLLIVLDAAAPFAAALGEREDVSYLIAHPAHPSVFAHRRDASGDYDFAGGRVPQDAVCCLISGEEEAFALGEQLARAMFAPVDVVHRVTLEQFILLEPTLTETVTATLLEVVNEAMEEVIARGVPAAVARRFLYGHIGIELAIIFGELEAPFSVSADYAIEKGRERIINPSWKSVFEPPVLRAIAEDVAAGALPTSRRQGVGAADAG